MSAPLEPPPDSWPTARAPHASGGPAPSTPTHDGTQMPAVVLVASIIAGIASTLTFAFAALAALVLGRAASAS